MLTGAFYVDRFHHNVALNDKMRVAAARWNLEVFNKWQGIAAECSLGQLDRMFIVGMFNETINPIIDAEIAYRLHGELLPSGD